MRKLLILIFAIFSLTSLYAQEAEEKEEHKKHAFSLSIGHTHVGEGVSNGKKKNIILPSWGFNYDFHINERWVIGLHNDMIIEEFEVEVEDDNGLLLTIERSRPISSAVTLSHRMNNFLILSAGVGKEFAPEEDFTIFRFGIEPFFKLPNNFEIIGTFAVDVRVDAYNAVNFGLGIVKLF